MLELRNVTKKYRSKKGYTTVALDNVSLKFGDKGMVFILGKSGSGKSTLLNVLGGLDKYDQGEIIIQGKSSKKFKPQDFDSYRNTYIGFVFQEFNILEDYTVSRNIALALQLQKKEVDASKIEKILEKLELTGLEHRKPNELSGGQKQRVAIARALVKNPDIIMADEPTGALDSKTGEQVFDVLKEISKDKLVIVVSHDRDAAEKYADRIVEFQDGKILHDNHPEVMESSSNPFQLIRSKLPWKESFKLGFGSLNHKKIRLAFTILLAACALGFLGLSDTMASFKLSKAHANLVKDEKLEYLKLEHFFHYDEYSHYKERFSDSSFRPTLLKNAVPFYHLVFQNEQLYLNSIGLNQKEETDIYRSNNYEPLEFIELSKKEDFIKEEIIGHYPNQMDEIAISNYLADLIIEAGITLPTNDSFGLPQVWKPKTYEELVTSGKQIELGEFGKVKIAGIINYDLSEFQSIKEVKRDYATREQLNLSSKLAQQMSMIYNKLFVMKGFLQNCVVSEKKENNLASESNFMFKVNEDYSSYVSDLQYLQSEVSYFDGTSWKKTSTLEKNQVLISIETLNMLRTAKAKPTESYQTQLENYRKKNLDADDNLFFENFVKSYNFVGQSLTLQEFSQYQFRGSKPSKEIPDFTIVGVVEENNYMAKEILEPYIEPSVSIYGYLTNQLDSSKLESQFENYPKDGEYSLKSIYSDSIEGIAGSMLVLKKFAFYASLVFFVFAILLIMNFIFTSITYRKKEIGILRAIGARNIDVLKIFLWEGFLIATISGVLASIGTKVVSVILNNYIQTHMGILIEPFQVTIRQYGLLLGTVFLIVLVASIFPIIKIARMKPMDAILNK